MSEFCSFFFSIVFVAFFLFISEMRVPIDRNRIFAKNTFFSFRNYAFDYQFATYIVYFTNIQIVCTLLASFDYMRAIVLCMCF